MPFLSREPALQAKVAGFFLSTWAIIYAVLRLGMGPLTGLSRTTVGWLSVIISFSLVFALQWKFGARVREWLDGGY